jgi:flagellar M-ring protein FliF
MPAALTLVALMLLLGVVRPALRPDPPPAPPEDAKLNAVVDDGNALPGLTLDEQLLLDAPKVEKQLIDARLMARENPLAVANILRMWIEGAPA